jgi:hypothetical protein
MIKLNKVLGIGVVIAAATILGVVTRTGHAHAVNYIDIIGYTDKGYNYTTRWPGATVAITNNTTGAPGSTRSNGSGYYAFVHAVVGNKYTLKGSIVSGGHTYYSDPVTFYAASNQSNAPIYLFLHP